MDKYDDNTWIGMDNSEGEWCVAYHGVGRNQNSDKVKKITRLIYEGGFKAGEAQAHRNCDNIYYNNKFNKLKKVGIGSYCTTKIEEAEEYSGITEIKGQQYKTVLMVRVNPESIRGCECEKNYWVTNGNNNEIRPYRILYKKI